MIRKKWKSPGIVCCAKLLACVAAMVVFANGCDRGAISTGAQSKSSAGPKGPAAEIFEKMMQDVKAKRDRDPDWQRKSNYDLLTVQTEDWLATEEGRFAHAIKIPNPVPADSGYRPGMTQQEYFEHLCKTEAGEFIFKTADNVEGIFQLRMRKFRYSEAEWQHLYAIEDPYGYDAGENDNPYREFIGGRLYSFIEALPSAWQKHYAWSPDIYHKSLTEPPPPEAKVARFYGKDGKHSTSVKVEYDKRPKARYGFTWRGIKRPNDREMGIAGGELIVLDLQTNEVMGVRRGYVIWNRGWTGRVCPRYGYDGGQDKATFFTFWFLGKVARPPKYREFFEELDRSRRIIGDPSEKRY